MARRDPAVALRQMLDHAVKAQRLIAGRSREEWETDEVLVLALVRLLEVVGEAASRVPPDMRFRHPEVPWRSIIGLRNVLIHGYDAIDDDVVWEVLVADLPRLIPLLEQMLEKERG